MHTTDSVMIMEHAKRRTFLEILSEILAIASLNVESLTATAMYVSGISGLTLCSLMYTLSCYHNTHVMVNYVSNTNKISIIFNLIENNYEENIVSILKNLRFSGKSRQLLCI